MSGIHRVLVTGGCGFIGRHLCLRLRREGFSVRVLDSLSEQVHGREPDVAWLKESGIELVRGSVCDQSSCERALDGVRTVFHLAAETGTGQSMYEMRRYVDTNVGGTASLLEECRAKGVEKCLLTSSRAVYGEGNWWCEDCGLVHPRIRERRDCAPASWNPRCPRCEAFASHCVPTLEGETLLPTSVYGVSKVAQEQLVNVIEQTSAMSCTTLRFFNVFGPGQALSNPYTGVLAVFVNRARAGKPIELFEDGEILRDFVYVDDVVDSLVKALSCSDRGPFNIGSGVGVTIRRLAEAIVDLTSSGSSIGLTGKMRIGDVRGLVADIKRAEGGLDWRPTTKFNEGLRQFVEWAMQRQFEDLYEKSMEELWQRGLYR